MVPPVRDEATGRVNRGCPAVTSGPAVDEDRHGGVSNGVVTRTVRDAAVMLDVLAGADPNGPYLPAVSPESYASAASVPPRALRIGFATESPIGTGVDGLQHVCDRLVFASLPWTHAEYEQIIGRIKRKGAVG